MELNQSGYSISELCKCARISRSSYYKWLNRKETQRDKENKEISNEIIKIYSEVKGIYGYRSGLMSIFWTQKVKLFYAALLANNSH